MSHGSIKPRQKKIRDSCSVDNDDDGDDDGVDEDDVDEGEAMVPPIVAAVAGVTPASR